MTTLLKILGLAGALGAALASSEALPASFTPQSSFSCTISTRISIKNEEVLCESLAPCPVPTGPCQAVDYLGYSGRILRYCKCENQQSEDPTSFGWCFIVGVFSPSNGHLVDYGCAINTCSNGCNCGAYAVPGEPGVYACNCE